MSRSTNFWILPVEVLGRLVKTTVRGDLKWARCSRQKAMISASVTGDAVLDRDEGAGRFAPAFVGAGDDGGVEYGGVAVEDGFDLDRRDVLAAGDDDVLGAVLQLDIAVLVHHAEVAGVEPAALEGFLRSRPGSSGSPSSPRCRA